jgi:hypothetical protein
MVSGAVSARAVSPDAGIASETARAAEGAHSAVWVGVYVSAARCLLTYVIAPAAGAIGVVLGPIGLLLQILGTVTAISGAHRLWTLRHRGRIAYAVVAGALTLFTAGTAGQYLLEGHP